MPIPDSLPLKKIPVPVLGNLIPPDESRVYFENCSKLPFDANTSAYSSNNAWWLAEASFLAYQVADKPLNATPLTTAGYQVDFVTEDSNQAAIIAGPEVIIAAFRGTHFWNLKDRFGLFRLKVVSLGDIITDIKALPSEIEPGRRVHLGFKQAFEKIWPKVQSRIASLQEAKSRPLWFTGHSLGAALATLAADRYTQAQGLYTFGSPKVGDKGFGAGFKQMNSYRFVNSGDLSSSLPPGKLYMHVGTPKFIHANGGVFDSPAAQTFGGSVRSTLSYGKRALNVLFSHPLNLVRPSHWPAPLQSLANHAPVYYANHLFNAAVAAGL